MPAQEAPPPPQDPTRSHPTTSTKEATHPTSTAIREDMEVTDLEVLVRALEQVGPRSMVLVATED